MLVTLAGGVGASRLLRGLCAVVDPATVVAVVNTGDDVVLHGLHVSPDLDTVSYALAGVVHPEQGWGRAGETWAVMEALAGLRPAAPPSSTAGLTWFRLGDRDLATHLYRTQRLRDGAALSEVTAELARAWGIASRLLPMTDDPVETRVVLEDEGEVGFQDYFVRRAHAVTVQAVRFAGAEQARPAPGVLEALAEAERVVIAPSNPLVSIAPVLAVPGIDEAVAARREETVAVSPIVAGAALRGPAARLLAELGHEPSVVGVARLWAPWTSTLVVDEADAALAPAVEEEGVRCVVAPTVMRGPEEAAALARVVLTGLGDGNAGDRP
ncbi:MAG TPA: 2-phospho-L-lactate transferase [Acidimicrobiales bacterium]|jgi:LPPG:FO 2-phospho-L-lactate transferase|nr:2-phospho-L-lactate transferase [Acidimicrobiales bacterium]